MHEHTIDHERMNVDIQIRLALRQRGFARCHRTPFRRGTEVLVRMELEDNRCRRRVSEEEKAALLAVASPILLSMIIAALDTGMRRGEMPALYKDLTFECLEGNAKGPRSGETTNESCKLPRRLRAST